MQQTFKTNKLQFIGTSEHHPNGYRRNFNNVVKDPAPATVEDFAAALASLTGEQMVLQYLVLI